MNGSPVMADVTLGGHAITIPLMIAQAYPVPSAGTRSSVDYPQRSGGSFAAPIAEGAGKLSFV
jgi:hypothetical protein